MAFLQRVHGVTHCDKVHSCDCHKDLNLKPLRKSRDPSRVGYCTKETSNTQTHKYLGYQSKVLICHRKLSTSFTLISESSGLNKCWTTSRF